MIFDASLHIPPSPEEIGDRFFRFRFLLIHEAMITQSPGFPVSAFAGYGTCNQTLAYSELRTSPTSINGARKHFIKAGRPYKA